MNRKIAVNRVVELADCTTAPMHLIEREQQVIDQALAILTSRLKEKNKAFYNASMVKAFLRLQLEPKKREHFAVMFLDAQHPPPTAWWYLSCYIDRLKARPYHQTRAAGYLSKASA